jgi:hypothetical protein
VQSDQVVNNSTLSHDSSSWGLQMKPIYALLGKRFNPVIDELSEWAKEFQTISKKLGRLGRKHPTRENLEIEFWIVLSKIQVRSMALMETIEETETALDAKKKSKKSKKRT